MGLSLIVGLAALALALVLLASLAPPPAPDLAELGRLLAAPPESLRPEPLERLLYVVGALLLPFCLGGAYLIVRRLRRPAGEHRARRATAGPARWFLPPLLFGLVLSAALADDRATVRLLVPGGASTALFAVALGVGATALAVGRGRERADRLLRPILRTLAGLLLLAVFLFVLHGTAQVRNTPPFRFSFNAIFHSVVQVFLGRELLVDFVNQYGLYPHFLEPVFRVTGLSVATFTAVMGLLNCAAFLCLYRLLLRETDELLAFLGLATILFFGYFSGRVVEPDLFLQYHPLRLVFPALSLVLARAFALRRSLLLGALLAATGAAAVLWNPDSGVAVLASGLLLPVYDAALRRRPREIPARVLLGCGAAIAVVASFALLLRLRYGAFPDYGRLLLYPEAFYLAGANMLPMPRFGLWVPVLLAYAVAMLRSLAALVEAEDTRRALLYFHLSVLGLGLFTYYQGRSVVGNLLAAGYPAVLLVVLFAEEVRRKAVRPRRAADRLLLATLLTPLCLSLPALAVVAPAWVRGISVRYRDAVAPDNEVSRDAAFLGKHFRPGGAAVIMSYNSGLYHLLTRTVSPLDMPGESELLLRKDFETLYRYAAQGRGPLAIDKTTYSAEMIEVFRRTNPVSYENPEGSLIVFPGATAVGPRAK